MRGYIVEQPHSVFGRQQLVAQRAFFAAAFPETPDDLYSRCTTGAVERQRRRVTIRPHAELSTNTFFGRFPASDCQRSRDLAQVASRVTASGPGRSSSGPS